MLARIWLDILTPKQVIFFKYLIDELKRNGNEILATSRRYRETEGVAKLYSLEPIYVGERGGKDRLSQLIADIKRSEQILEYVKKFSPDIAISVASNVCARIAFGLGIKHVAINDSPHSIIAGKLSLPLSHHLFCPWIIPYREWLKFGLGKDQITKYRALDPAAWLKRKNPSGKIPLLDLKKKTIVVRMEESFAPYMIGKDPSWPYKILDSLYKNFNEFNIVVLCRYDSQLEQVREMFGDKMIIPDEIIDARSLLEKADLFVGMGGTMTAEASLIGTPTITTYQGELYFEEYLRSKKLLFKVSSVKELIKIANELLDENVKLKMKRRAKVILSKMEDPIKVIASGLEKITGSS